MLDSWAADAVEPKPRIVLRDAVSNIDRDLGGAEHCLVYDRPFMPTGLTSGALLA
jgi:hypothetical protein